MYTSFDPVSEDIDTNQLVVVSELATSDVIVQCAYRVGSCPWK